MARISVGRQSTLDEVVVQGSGQPRYIAFGREIVECVGEIGSDFRITVVREKGQKTVGGSFAGIIGDAGFEPDRDDRVGRSVKHIG